MGRGLLHDPLDGGGRDTTCARLRIAKVRSQRLLSGPSS